MSDLELSGSGLQFAESVHGNGTGVRLPVTGTDSGTVAGSDWRQELLNAYSSAEDLHRAGLVSIAEATRLASIGDRFRVRIPRYYAELMRPEASCPIRQQALPSLHENDPSWPEWAVEWSRRAFGREVPWLDDAIGDLAKLGAARVTHRYGNRAILHVSSACAMYCRYCFRKSHLNSAERALYDGSLDPALEYLRAHDEIREVILTGGDPLTMTDAWLKGFFDKLESIAHLKHVRIHSKMPCTLPSRLTEGLAAAISRRRFVVSLVAHFNHPRELTPLALASLRRLREAGVPLYNQSVLLRGVNDSLETLAGLFQRLYEEGVTPYYLHHADWTPGTFHFRVPISVGQRLVRELAGRVSGPALPDYILDVPGGAGKISLLQDSRARRIETRTEGLLGGALYEITPSQTRRAESPRLYADFWAI